MGLYIYRKDDENSLVNPVELEQLDNNINSERSPEFDEMGTALNEM